MAIATCALSALALASSPGAAACPSWANVKSFKGTVSVSFSQAETKEGYVPFQQWASEGTWHGSFNQSAQGLQLKSLTPFPKKPKIPSALGRAFAGPTTGGKISVQDSMVEYEEDGAAGSETAAGPTISGGHGGEGIVQLAGPGSNDKPLGCNYTLAITYGIFPTVLTKRAFQGQLEVQPKLPLSFVAESTAEPIPAGLHLSGTAEVPAGIPPGSRPMPGGYAFSRSALEGDLEDMTDGHLDNAVMHWNLKPVLAKKNK